MTHRANRKFVKTSNIISAVLLVMMASALTSSALRVAHADTEGTKCQQQIFNSVGIACPGVQPTPYPGGYIIFADGKEQCFAGPDVGNQPSCCDYNESILLCASDNEYWGVEYDFAGQNIPYNCGGTHCVRVSWTVD